MWHTRFCLSVILVVVSRGFGQTATPTLAPISTADPSATPTHSPTFMPSISFKPSFNPTAEPSAPTFCPSVEPSSPTHSPSHIPSASPSLSESPTHILTELPSHVPTLAPSSLAPSSVAPTDSPTVVPTFVPTVAPSTPTATPTALPSTMPTPLPSATPSFAPSPMPTATPTIPSPSVTVSLTQKFSMTTVPSGFLVYNSSNYNVFVAVIQSNVKSHIGSKTAVTVNSLAQSTGKRSRRFLAAPTYVISARYTFVSTNGMSYADLSSAVSQTLFLSGFTSALLAAFPTLVITANGAPVDIVDNSPTASPTSSPTYTTINYKYFSLLALLVIPVAAAFIIYFNYTYCCVKDSTPRFHST